MPDDTLPKHWHLHGNAEAEIQLQLAIFHDTLQSLAAEYASLEPNRPPDEAEMITHQHVRRTAALLFPNRTLSDFYKTLRAQQDVFVSFKSEDDAFAKEVESKLKRKKLRVFRAPASIPAGADWEDDIFDSLRGARVVLFLVTHNSLKSEWCSYEVGAARALNKRVVCALRHVESADLPAALKRFQAIPAQDSSQLKQLVETILKICSGPR